MRIDPGLVSMDTKTKKIKFMTAIMACANMEHKVKTVTE